MRAGPVSAARRLAKRSFRTADRQFLVEGPQGIREALADAGPAGSPLISLLATDEAARRHPELIGAAEATGVEVHLVSGAVLAAIAQTVTPQGMVGVARFVDVDLATVVSAAPRLVVILAAVRDPGNAGTVIRAADAAGADAVILAPDSVDCYNGKCVRATAGSLFHLPVICDAPLAPTISALRGAGLRILAADGSAEPDLDTLAERGDLARRTGWLFGNEAWGLPAAALDLADAAVRVPIYGRAESLNLATAAAVCLYASARAQRAGNRPDGAGEPRPAGYVL